VQLGTSTARAVTGNVGDMVWVGGVGVNQFQIRSIEVR
jgi:hypothetical protein